MTQTITLLGATGSIGDSTLEVIANHRDVYEVVGVSGYHRLDKLLDICRKFTPKFVAVPMDKTTDFRQKLADAKLDCTVLGGDEGLVQLVRLCECDTVVSAIVGAAGLPSTLEAAKLGRRILLANKEALVMAGDLMMGTAKANNATILPIDSEHNAIFQCLPTAVQSDMNAIHNPKHGIKKLWLTASGGGFLNKSYEQMKAATVEEAVNHPNWSMGQKISIDSATMMNKGLELIEACYLFDLSPEDISVVIHPQSIVHSLVEYVDGSFLAQMSSPDMKVPIAYALAYPCRIDSGTKSLDLFNMSALEFIRPDGTKFACLDLAYQAIKKGARAAIALNAANEVAVAAFLDKDIALTDIANLIGQCLACEDLWNDADCQSPPTSLQEILAIDKRVRAYAKASLAHYKLDR